MPSSSNLDYLAATTKDLLTSIKQLNQDSPLDPFTDSEKQTMENFAKIFENKTQSKDPPPNETKVKKLSLENDEAPAPPLRVATEEPNAVPQRVQIEAAEPPPIQEHPTAPQRVQTEDTNLENAPDPDPVAIVHMTKTARGQHQSLLHKKMILPPMLPQQPMTTQEKIIVIAEASSATDQPPQAVDHPKKWK